MFPLPSDFTESVVLQGIRCFYRAKRPDEMALYENLPQEEQYFKRIDHPFTNDELVAIANKEYTYTDIQKKWVDDQKRIFDEGLYAYIDGVLTFIPGAYWGYINFWRLDTGEKPEYREDDRQFFLFHEYLRLYTSVLGIARLKGRRQGATSIGFFFMWFIGGRTANANCGTTSYNDVIAAKNFSQMFVTAFRSLLPCFQEDFSTDSEKYIKFEKEQDKRKKGVLAIAREGLNSFCDFLPNTVTSYDGGRQTYNIPDEWGKRGTKMDIGEHWSRLKKTLVIGSKKVGFAYMPSTIGSKKEGGENGKEFWKGCNQLEINPETNEPYGLDTPHQVVRWFSPATRGYLGYIDKFGKSIVDDPAQPVLTNQGTFVTEGAKTVIMRARIKLRNQKKERQMEEKRDYPLDEYDAFSFEIGKCEFDEDRIIARLKYLEENKGEAFWRRGMLSDRYDMETKRTIVEFIEHEKGDWYLRRNPNRPNAYKEVGIQIEADNVISYSIGADTYRNIFAEDGSDGVIAVMSKSNMVNGKEDGLMLEAIFIGRPRLIGLFNREAYLACLYWGAKINFEVDAGTWFYEDFLKWNAVRLLEWTPAVDLTKTSNKIKPGTESANPFQLAKQLEVMKIYMDGTSLFAYNGQCHRQTFVPLLQQALEYNHGERTPYHIVVAVMMALLPMLSQTRPPRNKPQREIQILPTTTIKVA